MKTAILTLDIMNEICHPDGKLAAYADRIEAKNMISKINQLTSWGRDQGHLIIHVRVGFHAHYLDCSTVSPIFSAAKTHQALLLDQWGGQFCDTLKQCKEDITLIKHRVSAFYGTDLALILQANRIERLIITGVATNIAVELTAREAHDRDFHIVVINDAIAGASDAIEQASLANMARISQCTTLDDFLKQHHDQSE